MIKGMARDEQCAGAVEILNRLHELEDENAKLKGEVAEKERYIETIRMLYRRMLSDRDEKLDAYRWSFYHGQRATGNGGQRLTTTTICNHRVIYGAKDL